MLFIRLSCINSLRCFSVSSKTLQGFQNFPFGKSDLFKKAQFICQTETPRLTGNAERM